MTIYDFDKTIYDGDSTVDFFLFCMKKRPRLVRFLPLALRLSLMYKLCIISYQDFLRAGERTLHVAVRELDNVDALVREFWDKHEHKIKSFYLQQKRDDDLILSGSCSIPFSSSPSSWSATAFSRHSQYWFMIPPVFLSISLSTSRFLFDLIRPGEQPCTF